MTRIDRLFAEITARAWLAAGEEIPTADPCRVCEDRPSSVVVTVHGCPDTVRACDDCAERFTFHAVKAGLGVSR